MPDSHGRPNRIMSHLFVQALADSGAIPNDPGDIRRLVIDARAGHVLTCYVELFGDERWLDVVPTLDGIEVRAHEVDDAPRH